MYTYKVTFKRTINFLANLQHDKYKHMYMHVV